MWKCSSHIRNLNCHLFIHMQIHYENRYNENCNNFIPLLFTDKCRYFFFGRLIQTEHYGKNNLLNESINCPERTMQKLIFRLNV